MKKVNKFKKLQQILKKMGSVLIAYSGGVDSTFLLKVAKNILKTQVLAVTAKSKLYPEREYNEARKTAKNLQVKHLTITTNELSNSYFCSNPQDRCYFCKKELFTKLQQIAANNNIKYLADGTNYDDKNDFRPGIKAVKEFNVKSPLKEAGLTKKEIRLLSYKIGLPTWNKPSFSCFSSRIPYGTKIDLQKVQMIEQAENFLWKLGIEQVRVRYHNNIARIEVFEDNIKQLTELRKKIVKKFKQIGFNYVTLDLEGYRTGSMNEVLISSKF